MSERVVEVVTEEVFITFLCFFISLFDAFLMIFKIIGDGEKQQRGGGGGVLEGVLVEVQRREDFGRGREKSR